MLEVEALRSVNYRMDAQSQHTLTLFVLLSQIYQSKIEIEKCFKHNERTSFQPSLFYTPLKFPLIHFFKQIEDLYSC